MDSSEEQIHVKHLLPPHQCEEQKEGITEDRL